MMQLSPPLQKKVTEALEAIAAALGDLQLIYEEMQTSLEASAVVEEDLFRQNQQAMQERQYYYDLFQSSPDAYLVTDANGLILEANPAIATSLNIPPSYLVSKVRELEEHQGWHIPAAALTAYLEEDRSKALTAGFESHLHKLAQPTELIEMVTRLAGRASTSTSAIRSTG